MEELAKMIYTQWQDSKEAEKAAWGDGYYDALRGLYKLLNEELASKIERNITRQVYGVEQVAFIAGFSHACKCFMDGRIEVKGGAA